MKQTKQGCCVIFYFDFLPRHNAKQWLGPGSQAINKLSVKYVFLCLLSWEHILHLE